MNVAAPYSKTAICRGQSYILRFVALRIMRARSISPLSEVFEEGQSAASFKLNTGQDDHAIMFLDDYLNQLSKRHRVASILSFTFREVVEKFDPSRSEPSTLVPSIGFLRSRSEEEELNRAAAAKVEELIAKLKGCNHRPCVIDNFFGLIEDSTRA